jgi:hypothetical protein
LTYEERELMAMMLAPGIARAYEVDEVVGFGPLEFAPLPERLVEAVRRSGIVVLGLDDR